METTPLPRSSSLPPLPGTPPASSPTPPVPPSTPPPAPPPASPPKTSSHLGLWLVLSFLLLLIGAGALGYIVVTIASHLLWSV